ncbi:MAG: hypothetical protein ABI383_03295 [Acidobacteriaceae bacterium]
MEEARKIAKEEGVAVNQIFVVAIAEKLSSLRTLDYLRKRAEQADLPRTKKILQRAGRGNPPLPGDELPEDFKESIKKKGFKGER